MCDHRTTPQGKEDAMDGGTVIPVAQTTAQDADGWSADDGPPEASDAVLQY
jgi:hypothetical protein